MKNHAPLISVVMPVYNGEKYLKQAIESVLSQEFSDFEFVIINDGSTDRTSRILRDIHDKRLKTITNNGNLGIVASLNEGIKASKGIYIARMDSDDISDAKRFGVQVEFLENHTDYAAVGSFVRVIDPGGKLLYTIEQPTRDQAIKRYLLSDSCIAHGSVMMRRSDVISVGMYSDSKLVKHAEDYDLFVRLGSKYKLSNIPDYLYTRVEHESSISHKYSDIQQLSANYISRKAKKIIHLNKVPRFSVLMPTYNKAEHISQSIESVKSQTFTDWELVIIDDKSTDNTKDIVGKYLDDPRINYLSNPINLGKSQTRNRLIKESLSGLIGELDSDDALKPEALSVMIHAHLKHHHSGFIYSQFAYCDELLNQKSIGFCRVGGPKESNLHNQYSSAFRTYKRKYFDKISGFDITLTGAEDLDVIYKMEEVAPIKFVNKVLYLYRRVPVKNNSDVIVGIFSSAKAKYYAYLRRRNTSAPNLTIFGLIRQLINLALTLLIRLINV